MPPASAANSRGRSPRPAPRSIVCDIDEKALTAIRAEIPGLIAAHCDMASRTAISRMVPEAVAALGGLDVLINNAGIAGMTLPVEQYPPDDWDKVVAVNLTAMFDVTRLAIPHLKKSAAGCIINMASIAGRFGFQNRSPYAATKWGVIGFTKTLAMELGEWGIRANAIAPGAVEGDRIERVFAGRAQISGKSHGGRARRSDGGAVDQGDDRPQGHRGARGVPGVAGGEVDLRAGAADR